MLNAAPVRVERACALWRAAASGSGRALPGLDIRGKGFRWCLRRVLAFGFLPFR
jgi:hypothetical protein